MSQLTRAFVRVVHLDMTSPFRTSFGEVHEREVVILEAEFGGSRMFGESAALSAPVYSAEYTRDVMECLRTHLLPRLFKQNISTPAELEQMLAPIRGHEMAKSAIVGAWTAAWAEEQGTSVAALLGSVREWIDCGISLGIYDAIDDLIQAIQGALDIGFSRIKLKIQPGWDVDVLRDVRQVFPETMITVDANASYDRGDIDHLTRMDEFDLAYIEQPLAEEDLIGHAMLQSRLATPVCLDESVVSGGSLESAIRLGALRVLNLKVGRVGGLWAAKLMHDICVENGVGVWCGGLMESAIGQAECLAVAGLPGFRYPADIGPSERYFLRDVGRIGPLIDGRIAVPRLVGQPVDVDESVLEESTVELLEVVARD